MMTRPEPQQKLKRIGRIMVKLWLRFHKAHVRIVRITIRYQSIRVDTGSIGLIYSQMQQAQ